MFLAIDHEILELKKLSLPAKIIVSHFLSLARSGRSFWGYWDWFERWGISAQLAGKVSGKLEEAGIIWQDSSGAWSIVNKDIAINKLQAMERINATE